ncbi:MULTISPECIES: MFS transporter [Arthrobacter]|uniref:MFS transporter n=1 Tax=Arthrobacter psychrochitiniphilus TaxID=291045 RepID=A0A2V3DUY1_9MICC|nr:MFS transporter [Arthrobacter psychrochitiniphilus]NYG15597.1 MFS family permease [Arthrobacter psychrochitiniphilus]PXA66916.1 MFS transporter [Arthrobacter psychrochitiniphilus]
MTPPPAELNASPTAPINLVATRPPWSQTFSSLKIRNYRIFASANLLAVIALWMQRVAQDWVVLELSGSVTAVGITVFMQFLPSLLLMPLGGILADRYSKRLILMISQGAAGVLATLMAVLALTGNLQVWHIYVIAFVLGLVVVADQPARQVFVNELVGPRQLRNAISLNSSIFQMGGMIGPAVSGVLIMAVGGGWAFAANALACTITVISLCLIRSSELVKMPPVQRAKGQLMEGVRYVLRKPTIFWPAMMAAVFAVFGLSLAVLLAAYANNVFDAGAGGYGLLNTLVALGALCGAIASTRFATLRLRGVMAAAGSYGVVLMIASLAPNMVTFGAVMVVAGFASLLFLTSANQLVQMSTNVRIRGRVMSLYIMVLMGGQALGGPLMGWLAEHWGVQWATVVAGGMPALAAVVIGLVLAKRGQLTLQINLRSAKKPVFIVPKTS